MLGMPCSNSQGVLSFIRVVLAIGLGVEFPCSCTQDVLESDGFVVDIACTHEASTQSSCTDSTCIDWLGRAADDFEELRQPVAISAVWALTGTLGLASRG
eukprot:165116-Amphidinium_carterae.1